MKAVIVCGSFLGGCTGRNVEDLLAERGIDVSYETVGFWWNRLGPIFAAKIRRKRVDRMRA